MKACALWCGLGVLLTIVMFLCSAWLATVALGGYLKDCETLGRTRLGGVAVECKVIRS